MAKQEAKKKYVSLKEANAALPSEVAEKFEITNWSNKRTSTKVFYPKFGEVNFKTISVNRAAQLVKLNFPLLKAKGSK